MPAPPADPALPAATPARHAQSDTKTVLCLVRVSFTSLSQVTMVGTIRVHTYGPPDRRKRHRVLDEGVGPSRPRRPGSGTLRGRAPRRAQPSQARVFCAPQGAGPAAARVSA